MQSWKPVFKSSSTYARTGPYTTVFISSTAIHSRVHMLHTSHSWRVDTCRSPQQLLIPRCFLVPSHYAVPKSYRRNEDWQFRRTRTVLGGPFLDPKSLHRCRRMHPKDSQIICSPGNPSLSPRRHMPVRGHTPRFSFHPLQSTAGYTCCTRPIPGELIHVGVRNSSSYHDVSSSHPIMPYPNPTGATKIGNLEGHGPSCAVLFWTPSRCIDAEECIQKIHRLYAVLETRL